MILEAVYMLVNFIDLESTTKCLGDLVLRSTE